MSLLSPHAAADERAVEAGRANGAAPLRLRNGRPERGDCEGPRNYMPTWPKLVTEQERLPRARP